MSFSSKSHENDDDDVHHIKDNQSDDKSDETNDEPLDPRIQVRFNKNLLKLESSSSYNRLN